MKEQQDAEISKLELTLRFCKFPHTWHKTIIFITSNFHASFKFINFANLGSESKKKIKKWTVWNLLDELKSINISYWNSKATFQSDFHHDFKIQWSPKLKHPHFKFSHTLRYVLCSRLKCHAHTSNYIPWFNISRIQVRATITCENLIRRISWMSVCSNRTILISRP